MDKVFFSILLITSLVSATFGQESAPSSSGNEPINDPTNESTNDLTNEFANDLTNEFANDLTNEPANDPSSKEEITNYKINEYEQGKLDYEQEAYLAQLDTLALNEYWDRQEKGESPDHDLYEDEEEEDWDDEEEGATEDGTPKEESKRRRKKRDTDQPRNVYVEKDVSLSTGNQYQSQGYSSYPQNYGYNSRPSGPPYNVPQYRPRRQCTVTGLPCTNGTVCCSDVCEPMPRPNEPRKCCLSEGLICDNSAPGNKGLLPCCNGLFCDQLSTLPQLTVCQERLYKFENGK